MAYHQAMTFRIIAVEVLAVVGWDEGEEPYRLKST
jgi:hypothetical protein